MEISNYVAVLAALAQPSRLAIFRLLVTAGPDGITPGEMAKQLDLPAATLSFHLKELSQVALVDKLKQGRSIRYSANYQTMTQLIAFLSENCCSIKF